MRRRRPNRERALLIEAQRLLPSLTSVVAALGNDPEEVASRTFPEADLGARQIIGEKAKLAGKAIGEVDLEVRKHRLAALAAGGRAVDKLGADGAGATLTADEKAGLEVIYNLMARPAILFQGRTFVAPPPPWESLNGDKQSIEDTAASVGRIQLTGGPNVPFVGTGFLVAEDVVMTNAHVATIFAGRATGGAWAFRPGMTANIDYAADPDGPDTPAFTVTSVIGIHERFDLALLKVEHTAGHGAKAIRAPKPLVIASQAPEPAIDRTVFVVGYPARDSAGAEAMSLVFADIYNVKRLQPGVILEGPDGAGLFKHDCSTLSGNSGSCVVDLESNEVIGLHFQGLYLHYNQAVALWALRGDPLFKAAGVRFA